MALQFTPGYRFFRSVGTFFDASPMISMLRTKARFEGCILDEVLFLQIVAFIHEVFRLIEYVTEILKRREGHTRPP